MNSPTGADGNNRTGSYVPPAVSWNAPGLGPQQEQQAVVVDVENNNQDGVDSPIVSLFQSAGNASLENNSNDDNNADDEHNQDCDSNTINTGDYTAVTDWSQMHRDYGNSSVCTEAMEETGLKDPMGFYIIAAVVLVGGMSRGITFPTLWLFVKSLGGSTVTMGWSVAAFSFGRALTSPIFGRLSVEKGYKYALTISMTFVSMGAFLYTQAGILSSDRPTCLIVAQSVLGIGTGTFGVTRGYVAEVTPKGLRTRYLAYLAAVMHGGFTVSPFIGAFLIYCFENPETGEPDKEISLLGGFVVLNMYTAPAYTLLLVCIVCQIIIQFYFQHERRELMPRLTKSVKRANKDSHRSDSIPIAVTLGQAQTKCCCCIPMTMIDSIIWFVVALNVVSKGCVSIYETLGVKIAEEMFDIESTTVGITLGCSGIVGVLLLLSFKTISKHISDVTIISVGLLISVVGITCLTDFGGSRMGLGRFVPGIFLVLGVGYPVSDTAIVGLFSKVVGNRPQGTFQGMLAMSSALARMVVPIVGSYVSQYIGMAPLFITINIVLVFSAALVAFGYRNTLTILSSSTGSSALT